MRFRGSDWQGKIEEQKDVVEGVEGVEGVEVEVEEKVECIRYVWMF